MNRELVNITASYLAEAIETGYRRGIKDVVKNNKKLLKKYKKDPLVTANYTDIDKLAVQHFKAECFEVAGVMNYKLEERLKKLALETWEKSESFKYFEEEARRIMLEYLPLEDQPPRGYLETNFNTALNSSYSAAQYNRLNDPDVKDLYPAYQYMTQNDDRVREEHALLHERIFYNDDPILDIIYPPNGWNCRCFIIPLDSSELIDKDIESKNRTEEQTEEIKKQVDENFRRNAAKDNSIFDKWLNQEYKDMSKADVKEIKKQAVGFGKL